MRRAQSGVGHFISESTTWPTTIRKAQNSMRATRIAMRILSFHGMLNVANVV
jgi:hypothetical protein